MQTTRSQGESLKGNASLASLDCRAHYLMLCQVETPVHVPIQTGNDRFEEALVFPAGPPNLSGSLGMKQCSKLAMW